MVCGLETTNKLRKNELFSVVFLAPGVNYLQVLEPTRHLKLHNF